MRYAFDDKRFGLTTDNRRIDEPMVDRPPGISNLDWYVFAGRLARLLNERHPEHGA